jgi:hypothetical protein
MGTQDGPGARQSQEELTTAGSPAKDGLISPGRWAAGKHSGRAGSGRTAGEFLSSLAVDNMWITCAKMAPNLCVHWGDVGDTIAEPSHNDVLTWHNTPYILCIDKELKLSTRHAATPVNKPNVYRRYIRS